MKIALPAHILVVIASSIAIGCNEAVAPVVDLPPEVPAVYLEFASVTAGLDHTCAIVSGGDAYCWGRGLNGTLGADSLESALTPSLTKGGIKFSQVTAGEEHTCGLDVQGSHFCWGSGDQGQLGVGDVSDRLRPVRGPLTYLKFRHLSAGGFHTCGVTTENRAYCWGWNVFGQIGNNSTIGQQLPVEVHGSVPWASIGAGPRHTCGITTQGAAYCWGDGLRGQLGDGFTVSRLGAAGVAGGLRFVAVSAGGEHSCGITDTGAAYCWGAGEIGQLGSGARMSSPVPVPVTGNRNFVNIDASVEHTCAVSRDGELYCWGHNNFGRLGNAGLPTILATPTRVGADSTRFISVSTGRLHSCALTTTADLYCWGFGGFGQLGNGAVLNRSTPTRVLIVKRDSVATPS